MENERNFQPEDFEPENFSVGDAVEDLFKEKDSKGAEEPNQATPDSENDNQFEEAIEPDEIILRRDRQLGPATIEQEQTDEEYDHTIHSKTKRAGRPRPNVNAKTAKEKTAQRLRLRRTFWVGLVATAGIGTLVYMCGGGGGEKASGGAFGGAGHGISKLADQGFEEFGDTENRIAYDISQGKPGSVEEFLVSITRANDGFYAKDKNDIADYEKWHDNMKEYAEAVEKQIKTAEIENDQISEWAERLGHSPESAKWLERFVKLNNKEEGFEKLSQDDLIDYKNYYLTQLFPGDTW